jgi:hypothetical protein
MRGEDEVHFKCPSRGSVLSQYNILNIVPNCVTNNNMAGSLPIHRPLLCNTYLLARSALYVVKMKKSKQKKKEERWKKVERRGVHHLSELVITCSLIPRVLPGLHLAVLTRTHPAGAEFRRVDLVPGSTPRVRSPAGCLFTLPPVAVG